MAPQKCLALICLPLLIITIATSVHATATVAKTSRNSVNFIKSSCQSTLYPDLCLKSLSTYATTIKLSQAKLTHTALFISLAKAKTSKIYISKMAKTKGLKLGDREALKDCLENVGSAIDRIKASVQEMGQLTHQASDREFRWHMSNVQTWVSAALTCENTCVDGLTDEAVNQKVNAKLSPLLVNVKQVTSNALALVNRFVDQRY